MYFFLLFFNCLSGVYLYMADFDLVKNNMSRARILSTVSKMVSSRKKGKKHKKKDQEEATVVEMEDEGLIGGDFDEKNKEDEEGEGETLKGDILYGDGEEEEGEERKGGEKNNLLSKAFIQKILQYNEENFCAWDYQDLCFLTTTLFLNMVIIIYTINTFSTKPPYCSGGGLPSSLDYTLFSLGMLFVCVLLGAWGAWKYKIQNLNVKWNTRKTESKVLKYLRYLRDVMVGGAILYILVDVSLFFLHSFGLF